MDLSFPKIYLLAKDLDDETRHALEKEMNSLESRPLTDDANEAEVFLGKVFGKSRALLELRRLKITTEEILPLDPPEHPQAKRRKITADNTDSELSSNDEPVLLYETGTDISGQKGHQAYDDPDAIKVVKLAWYTDSIAQQKLLPYGDYLVYEGRKIDPSQVKPEAAPSKPRPTTTSADILKRAVADSARSKGSSHPHFHSRKRQHDTPSSSQSSRPGLHHMSTSEYDINIQLPPLPTFMSSPYSCTWSTPFHSPNAAFIAQLTTVRKARELEHDKIGIRAYSSAIAAVQAYPHTLSTPAEVARLPGCGQKIAEVFHIFSEMGSIPEAAEAEADERMAVLREFSKIYGVAETTAREFYDKRGWRDMDDVVEYGWNNLSRVQQIGVKYFDELQERVPRAEVEKIADVVLSRARQIAPGFEMVIVGSYRRGQESSGDVDIVLSHRDESKTKDFIEKLVLKLEKEGYVTHTLSLTDRNSRRNQNPVSWKAEKAAGSGFDSLDKALTVWQDPVWDEGDGNSKGDGSETKRKKNSNPHRQVDIIISPWKTVGCAVLGWSGGTTFQRDLRRYCKKERNLKFDSSGIRSRKDGLWVDFESDENGPAPDMLTAERRVFEGLGLTFRPPEERCTG